MTTSKKIEDAARTYVTALRRVRGIEKRGARTPEQVRELRDARLTVQDAVDQLEFSIDGAITRERKSQ